MGFPFLYGFKNWSARQERTPRADDSERLNRNAGVKIALAENPGHRRRGEIMAQQEVTEETETGGRQTKPSVAPHIIPRVPLLTPVQSENIFRGALHADAHRPK